MIHRTPAIRETAIAAAHAEGKTVTVTTIPTAEDLMAANPAAAGVTVANAKAEPSKAPANPSAAQCQNPSNSLGGRSSSRLSVFTKNLSAHHAQSVVQMPLSPRRLANHAAPRHVISAAGVRKNRPAINPEEANVVTVAIAIGIALGVATRQPSRTAAST